MIPMPKWATPIVAAREGRLPVYVVDPDKAYPALWEDLTKSLKDVLARPNLAHDEAIAVANAVLGLPPEADAEIAGDDKARQIAELVTAARERLADGLALDAYWMEALYQFVKMRLQTVLGDFAFEIHIRGSGDYKNRWAQKTFTAGRGIEAATHGLEAREHFRRCHGFIPSAR